MRKIVKNRDFKKIISTLFTIAVIVLIGLFLLQNKSLFNKLNNIKLKVIIQISFIYIITIGIIALINRNMIRRISQDISFLDCLLLQWVNNLLNKIFTKGGAIYRGVYLKEKYSFPYAKFLSTFGGFYVIGFFVNSLVGIFCSFIIFMNHGTYNIFIIFVFASLFLFSLIIVIINPQIKVSNWFNKNVSLIIKGWDEIKNEKKYVGILLILNLLTLVLSALQIIIIYRSLGESISFINSLFYSSLSGVANFINLTPGGLGINEAVFMFSSEVIGISEENILVGSLLLRAITFIPSLVLGGGSYFFLNNRLSKTNVK